MIPVKNLSLLVLRVSYPSSSPSSILIPDSRVLPRAIFQDQKEEMNSIHRPEDTSSWNVFFFEFQGL